MKKIVILIFILLITFLSWYYFAGHNNLIDAENVKSAHIIQERIDGKNIQNEQPLIGYLDLEEESVQIFFNAINKADHSRERVSTAMLTQEYGHCEYFREVYIEETEGKTVFIYYGFSENEDAELPVYVVKQSGAGYRITDAAVIEAMNRMTDVFSMKLQ